MLVSTQKLKAYDEVTPLSDGAPVTEEIVTHEFDKFSSDADTEYRRLLGAPRVLHQRSGSGSP